MTVRHSKTERGVPSSAFDQVKDDSDFVSQASSPLVTYSGQEAGFFRHGREIEVSIFVKAEDLRLWWPHTLLGGGAIASPHLYTATFELLDVTTAPDTISRPTRPASAPSRSRGCVHAVARHFGVRSVESYYDETIEARAFLVNGFRVYIEGGNWITTDAMLRFAADRQRYDDEVRHFFARKSSFECEYLTVAPFLEGCSSQSHGTQPHPRMGRRRD